MSALLVALGVGIVSYVAMIMLFPKAVPEDAGDLTRQALERIYEENRAAVEEERNALRESLGEEGFLSRLVFSLPILRPLYEAALHAGYQKSLNQLTIAMLAILVFSCWLLLRLKFGVLAFLLAPFFAYALTYQHCLGRVKKRNAQFINQFPDALDIIVRSVRSGFPVTAALQMLAENTENPVRQEFRQVVDDLALGRTLSQALSRLALRINEPDIRFFVVVLAVQQETGGNLAEIINNLSSVIRKRKQLKNKIKALTAEGRATGWVLSMLPVLVFVTLYFLQHNYIQVFWRDPLGQLMLGSVVAMIVLCNFIIRQMVAVEI